MLSWNSAVVNIYNLERDELHHTNLPNTHNGDYTEWRLNTLQNTLKKQTKEAMGGTIVKGERGWTLLAQRTAENRLRWRETVTVICGAPTTLKGYGID